MRDMTCHFCNEALASPVTSHTSVVSSARPLVMFSCLALEGK